MIGLSYRKSYFSTATLHNLTFLRKFAIIKSGVVMDKLKAIKERHSVRKYLKKEIEQEKVDRLNFRETF